jgi:hypothetical protein
MKTTITVWDKDTSPIVEERVDGGVGVHEDVLVKGGFGRVSFGASKLSCGALETVIKHAVEAITSAETSSFKEKNELISLGADVKVYGGGRTIEASGASVLVDNVVEDEVEGLAMGTCQEEKE